MSYLLNIPVLANEHWALLQMMSRPTKESGFIQLVQLLARLKRHFHAEEDYMREIGFPQIDEHIREHESLVGHLENLASMPS